MTIDQRTVAQQIRERASAEGMNLQGDAFIYAKWTPQGWLLKEFSDWMSAEAYALALHREGNTDIYVMSSNEQHGLQKVIDGKLEHI
jgi:hypothetical protein